ncbi:hypothetical protein C8J56DRAFT_901442 [Mycena floridula]|nr:hypothetical protein C8J56DRAFT_901442 [Mycena floridula]
MKVSTMILLAMTVASSAAVPTRLEARGRNAAAATSSAAAAVSTKETHLRHTCPPAGFYRGRKSKNDSGQNSVKKVPRIRTLINLDRSDLSLVFRDINVVSIAYNQLRGLYASGMPAAEIMVINTNYKWFEDLLENEQSFPSGNGATFPAPRKEDHYDRRSYPGSDPEAAQ